MVRTSKFDDAKFESIQHLEDRKASIQAENQQNEAIAKETAENKEIADFRGLPRDGETRDQLLDRIRKLREVPAVEPGPEAFGRTSEGLIKQFNAEQEAGRAAVAKAAAEMERNREIWQQAVEAEKKSAEARAGLSPQSRNG